MTAQLDVYPMPGRKARGYVLDVQADLLADLAARTAVPLLPEEDVRAAMRGLNPVSGIMGKAARHADPSHRDSSPQRTARPGHFAMAEHTVVLRALDILFAGV